MAQLNQWDLQGFQWINQSFFPGTLDSFARFLSSSSTWWVLALAIAVTALITRRWGWLKILLVCALAIGASDALSTYALKPAFGRIRPCYQLNVRLGNDGCGSMNGMPSNHAANGAAVTAVAATFIAGPVAWVIAGIAGLVGLSRIYLGVHFPGDVLAGYFFGGLVGLAISRLMLLVFRYKKTFLGCSVES